MFRTQTKLLFGFALKFCRLAKKEKTGVFLGFSNQITFQKMKFYF
jgi:hypothetical protein